MLWKANKRFSPEWIYQHIYRDKAKGGNLYRHLRSQRKRRKRDGKNSKRGALINQISIEQRSLIGAEKGRLGDWEVDSVMGKAQQGAIVTMVERKSRIIADETGRTQNRRVDQSGDL